MATSKTATPVPSVTPVPTSNAISAYVIIEADSPNELVTKVMKKLGDWQPMGGAVANPTATTGKRVMQTMVKYGK